MASPTRLDFEDDLAGAIAATILSGLVVGRFHALRDLVEPTLLFAERLPSIPASWNDDRLIRRAVTFLEGKDLLRPDLFASMTDSARQGAFSIAGVTRKTMLRVARDEVAVAAARGLSPEAAGMRVNRALARAGYQTLRPWHARLVAQQNFAGAYGSASWTALHEPRIRGLIPFFRYLTKDDLRVRPAHAALHNRYYRRDNPIWLTIWPPNGFNCRCVVVGVTANTVKLYGIFEDSWPTISGDPVLPDPGFRSNPGAYLRRQARATASTR